MDETLYTFQIPAAELPACEQELLDLLNSNFSQSGQEISDMAADLIDQAMAFLDIKGGFRLFDKNRFVINEEQLVCDQVVFNSRMTINRQLSGSTRLAVFAVTLGAQFDAWSRGFFEQNEPFSAYTADLIGSIRTDQATDWLENTLMSDMADYNLKCTNRYSPGYCGWDVSEQHKLFSLFPEHFLGITLTPSALMMPLKSISGIIGIGEQVERQPYTCAFCELEDCFMRR